MPTSISIGTTTGARRAHFALADPTNRLMNAHKTMINVSSIGSGRFELSRISAPLMAKIRPRFDQLNMATKCAAAKASTR